MKLQLAISKIYSYKNIEKFLSELHEIENFNHSDSAYFNIPHLSLENKIDQLYFYIKCSKNTLKNTTLLIWSDELTLKDVCYFREKHPSLEVIYIFSPNGKINFELPKYCSLFVPQVHLKKINFKKCKVFVLKNTFELNLKNAMLNSIYSKGAIPYLHSPPLPINFTIEKIIPLSPQHSLHITRRLQ